MRPPPVCDLCGSSQNARAPYLTLWDGTAFDLCKVCAVEGDLVKLLDELGYRIALRQAGKTPPPAGAQGTQPHE